MIHGVEEIRASRLRPYAKLSTGSILDRSGRRWRIGRGHLGGRRGPLVYLAGPHSIHFGRKRVLVLDIAAAVWSLPLARPHGQARDLGDWGSADDGALITTDPIYWQESWRLTRHVRKTLAPFARKVRKLGFDTVVGPPYGALSGAPRIESATGKAREPASRRGVDSDLRTTGVALTDLDQRAPREDAGLDSRARISS